MTKATCRKLPRPNSKLHDRWGMMPCLRIMLPFGERFGGSVIYRSREMSRRNKEYASTYSSSCKRIPAQMRGLTSDQRDLQGRSTVEARIGTRKHIACLSTSALQILKLPATCSFTGTSTWPRPLRMVRNLDLSAVLPCTRW